MRTIPSAGLLGSAALVLSAPAMAEEVRLETEADAPIIVTARQRPEDAQDVPAALSVLDTNWLEQSYTLNTRDLTTLVPALNYSSANPRNTAFTIRGLGSSVVAVSQANDGLEPGVGYYVDGVYHARPATAAFDFSDIERIEVLRGPQGTLFGKNTTAGAINIVSAAPSFTRGVNAELSVGERQFVQTRVSATGPIAGNRLAFRLSGTLTRRDGVLRNIVNGRDPNTLGAQAVRGQLLWQPSSDVRLRVIADFANFDSECCTQVFLRIGTSLRPAARQFPALAAAAGYAPPSTNPYDRLTDIDAPLAVKTSEGGVSATADWDIGAATVTSISAWRFWNWDAANDRDYTGLPIQLIQRIPSRQAQISQELRIASNGEGAFKYVAGLYYFRQVLTGQPNSVYGPYGAPWLSEAQMRRIEPYFPLSHGIPRVDDRRIVSGIIFVIRNGLRWRDAPTGYGPHKTIYNRFIRWSRLGVFNRIFAELAAKGGKPDRLMIDTTHLKAHRTAASLLKKGLYPDVSGAPKAA